VITGEYDDETELRFQYKVVGACVTHVNNPGVRCTGPDCPDTDSWENYQAGWRIHGGAVVEHRYVDALGETSSRRFNARGSVVAATSALGQTMLYDRDPGTNLITKVTDGAGRITRYQGYGFLASQPDPPSGGTSAVLATGVTACRFSVDGTLVAARSALVSLALTLGTSTSTGTESVSLHHAVFVSNLP